MDFGVGGGHTRSDPSMPDSISYHRCHVDRAEDHLMEAKVNSFCKCLLNMAAQMGGEERCLLPRVTPGSVAVERVILHTEESAGGASAKSNQHTYVLQK